MKVLLLGSGASQGTLGAPGVDRFLTRLAKIHKNWRRDYPALARVVDDTERLLDESGAPPGEPGLDAIWTRIDYFAKLKASLRRSDYGSLAADEIYRAVAEVYSLDKEIERILGQAQSRKSTLVRLLEKLNPGDAIISFNWDVATEQLAVRMTSAPLVQAPHPGIRPHHVRLIKPHGSLSWRRNGAEVEWHDGAGKPRLRPLKPKEIAPRRRGQRKDVVPLILGAVPIKSELILEVQGFYRFPEVFRLIADQWAEVLSALAEAEEVVIAGYRFPPEDLYGRFLFREAVRRRIRPTRIRLYQIDGRPRKETEKAIREIWRVSSKYEGEVKP